MNKEASKFSPAPWKTDEHEHDAPYQNIRIIDAHGHTVCTVWIDDAPVPDFNARQGLNAQLLAAAPEMLRVLQVVEEYLAARVINTNGTGEREILPLLTGIIAKANGQ